MKLENHSLQKITITRGDIEEYLQTEFNDSEIKVYGERKNEGVCILDRDGECIGFYETTYHSDKDVNTFRGERSIHYVKIYTNKEINCIKWTQQYIFYPDKGLGWNGEAIYQVCIDINSLIEYILINLFKDSTYINYSLISSDGDVCVFESLLKEIIILR